MAKATPTELDSAASFLPSVAVPAITTAPQANNYADSQDSSPRSRGTDSETFRWDEAAVAPPANLVHRSGKLRLMCSYGGRIVPRPHDKTLCYLGGESRIVVADRQASLSELTARLSKQLLSGRLFSLKYQLPYEDLDSLISVTTDDDLDNMIEEYDRCAASPKPSRLRLFLFPEKPDTPATLGSLLENSKADKWFVDALNGTVSVGLPRGFSDTSVDSVNRLLGLDSYVSEDWEHQSHQEHSAGEDAGINGTSASGIAKPVKAEVQSIPDSPMMETSSSFGSTSSAPSVSNLLPAGVKVEDPACAPVASGGLAVVEDQLSQMTLPSEKPLEAELSPIRDNPPLPSESLHQAPRIPKPVCNQDPSRLPVAPVANPAFAGTKENTEQNYRVQMPYVGDNGILIQQSLAPEYHYLHSQADAIPPPPIPSFYQVHHHTQKQPQKHQQHQVERPSPIYILHPNSSMAMLRQNQAYNLAPYHYAIADPSSNPSSAPLLQPSKDPSTVFSYATPQPPPSSSRLAPQPELAASLYRPAATPTMVPLTAAPLVPRADQQQYGGYHLLPTSHLGYDFPPKIVHRQTVPVNAAGAAAPAPAAVEASMQQIIDAKQEKS